MTPRQSRNNANVVDHTLPTLIADRWKLGTLLSIGCYGEVLEATDMNTGESVAAKLELTSPGHSFLCQEFEIYKALERSSSESAGS